MPRWVMIVDLTKCVGCNTCTMICKLGNKVPPGATWRKLVDLEMGGNPKGQRLLLTMSCMHCDNPPCLEVCPTGATHRRPDGIIAIDYSLCMGCGSCIVACPYLARKILFEDWISLEHGAGPKDTNVSSPDRIGVCTKCDFCLPRLDIGLADGLRPGVDPEATPLCARFCIAEALYFGDLEDSESDVSRLVRENKTTRLHEELNTDPSVYYILE